MEFGNIAKMQDPFGDLLGQEEAKKQLLTALLMKRHVILVGPPGVGKTTLAKNIAKLLPAIKVNDCPYHCDPQAPLCPSCIKKHPERHEIKGEERFVRVQGSPDLNAEDLLGDIDPVKALQYGPQSIEAFTPGKIFRANQGILFFDELNRCPEKLQNALLQVLEEGKATIGPYSVDLPANFLFIGTLNPEESAGTEKLSDVFLDRFDFIHITYPENTQTEKKIVLQKGKKLQTEFPEPLLEFTVQFIQSLRESNELQKKPSVRASLGVYERAQSYALLSKHKEVQFEDIAAVLVSVLAHRIELKPSLKYLQTKEQFLKEQFQQFIQEHPPEQVKQGGGL